MTTVPAHTRKSASIGPWSEIANHSAVVLARDIPDNHAQSTVAP
jgi:hypothetical protein